MAALNHFAANHFRAVHFRTFFGVLITRYVFNAIYDKYAQADAVYWYAVALLAVWVMNTYDGPAIYEFAADIDAVYDFTADLESVFDKYKTDTVQED